MVNLTVTITAIIKTTSAFDDVVTFSCFDGEDTELVAFSSTIDVPHACFLAEHELKNDFSSAYGQLIYAMNDNGVDGLTVGQTFTS